MTDPKSEIRNPRSEGRPKSEIRRPNGYRLPVASNFGSRISDFLRFSDLGFRISAPAFLRISGFGFRALRIGSRRYS